MTKKTKAGTILLYFVAALLLVLGIASLLLSVLPPHLLEFLGRPEDQVDPEFAQAIFMLIKIIGVLYLGIGATLIILTKRLLRQDINGSRLAIAALLFPYLFIPMITMPAGFGPPMVYVPIILVCTAIALILVGSAKEAKALPEGASKTV